MGIIYGDTVVVNYGIAQERVSVLSKHSMHLDDLVTLHTAGLIDLHSE